MRPTLILTLGVTFLALAMLGIWHVYQPTQPPLEDKPLTLELEPVTWAQVPGWRAEELRPALGAFQRSCKRIMRGDPDAAMGGHAVYGAKGDWHRVCETALALSDPDDQQIKTYFETGLVPHKVLLPEGKDGLYTGYYEPEMDGALEPSEEYATPLLARPDDLVMVYLGEFRDHLKGERIAGRVISGTLKPYESRAEIEAGELGEKAFPLAYVRDPVDAFFLHIQGSGRVTLPDGGVLRVGFAGQNGHPYTSIGRVLIRRGLLPRDQVTMQSLRAWLADNPDLRDEILNANASYVFFRDLQIDDPSLGPIGAEGLPLTPMHSLAVDRSFHAMGVPMWTDTLMPLTAEPLQNLMIAQDTGGAIRGPVRGDVFFGFGGDAPLLAGGMKRTGDLYVFLPPALAASLAANLMPPESP